MKANCDDDCNVNNTTFLTLLRLVARDIGGSDPERMAPPRVAEYVRKVFEGSQVRVEVVEDDATLQKEFPLFSAVNRCAKGDHTSSYYLLYLSRGVISCIRILITDTM